jgi:hypothetical protein
LSPLFCGIIQPVAKVGNQKALYLLIWGLIGAAALSGLLVDGVDALTGLVRLQTAPARLLQDFVEIGGTGATLINAALVAAIGMLVTHLSGIQLSGPTIAAVFTMFGFGMLGKTPLAILPVMAGVALAARVARKPLGAYLLIALFGTAIAPVVSMTAIELLPSSPIIGFSAAVAAGLAVGFILPAFAMAMLRFHQGYSLYNLGMTAGMVAIFVSAIVLALKPDLQLHGTWGTSSSPMISATIVVSSLVLIAAGIVFDGRKAITTLPAIMREAGRLPSDFLDIVGTGASLVNMGLMGLASWGFLQLFGIPVNGPMAGAVYTVVGFGAFGKHLRNSWPVVAGVVLGSFLFGLPLSAPGVALAALFVTTLAPIAGQFGPVVGIVVGLFHLLIVMQTTAWHSGINLYNNGFAGGLTATMAIALIEWYQSNIGSEGRRSSL